MKQYGLVARARRKTRMTTNSNHKLPVAPNLLNQDFTVQKPNQVWVTDISYFQTDLVKLRRTSETLKTEGCNNQEIPVAKLWKNNLQFSGEKHLQKIAAHIIMEKDGNSLSVYYENPTQQEIGVLYVNEPANN